MNRRVLVTALALAVWILCSIAAAAAQDPVVVVFYREGCEDCLRMEPVLKELEAQYPSLGFRFIEAADPDAPWMWSLAARYGVVPSQFPVIFVGREAIVGSSLSNELRLRSAVKACADSACTSPLASLRAPAFPWTAVLVAALVVLVLGLVILI